MANRLTIFTARSNENTQLSNRKNFLKALRPALQHRDPNVPFCRKDEAYPVPKGESYYARAKKAEYVQKDLKLAQQLYVKAIETADRAESAVKDLAGVLHQQGKTHEAIATLECYKNTFTDTLKYNNLLQNLHRQVVQKGNRLNKLLKISHLPRKFSQEEVKKLFAKPQRVQNIECDEDYAIVKFGSHSAARKTLESFLAWDIFKVEWLSITGDTAGEAQMSNEVAYVKDKALFLYRVFLKESQERAMTVDEPVETSPCELNDCEGQSLLGVELFIDINDN